MSTPAIGGRTGLASPPGLGAAVSTSVAGKAAEVASLAILTLLVPRILGPADYGRFAIALTLVTLGTLALTLGGPTVMGRFVPAAPAGERAALARALTARYARTRAAAVAALTVLGIALVAVDAVDALHAALVLGALAASVGTTLALQAGLGIGRVGPWSIRFALQNTLTIGAALALYAAWGADGAIAGILVGAAGTAVWAWASIGRTVLRAPSGAVAPPDALRFGAWQAVAGTLSQVAQRGGIVLVAVTASATQAGYAALAIGLGLAGTYVVLQAFTVVLPALSEGGADVAGASDAALRRLGILALAVTAPAAIAGAALAPELVPVVVGDEYRGAATSVGVALALVPLAAVTSLGVQSAALALRPRAATWAAGTGVLAGSVTAVVAIAAFGPADAGTGVAATVAAAAATAVAWFALLRPAVGRLLVTGALAAAALVLLAGSVA